MFSRSNKLIAPQGTGLLVIDIQERLLPAINEIDRVLDYTLKLILGAKEYSVPVFYTEQYTKGLGATALRLQPYLKDAFYYHKMSFSCAGADGLFVDMQKRGVTRVILAGIESHVCVLQTAMDLLTNGFEVILAVDAVSSRFERDYTFAISRMLAAGVMVASTESLLFEMTVESGTPQFKKISKIVKGEYQVE